MARGFRQAGHGPSLAAALIHFDVSFLCWVLVGALGAYIAAVAGLAAFAVAGRDRAWAMPSRPGTLSEAVA